MPVDSFERIALPCDCAGMCTILVFEQIDPDRPEIWVEHYTTYPALSGRERVKLVLALLLGREARSNDMLLSDAELRRLQAWLDGRLARHG